MKLNVKGFENGKSIPHEFAFCVPSAHNHVSMGTNMNPEITWENVSEGTKSFALIIVDPDVPSNPDDVNQEGKTVPKSLERINFYHLVMCNITADTNKIEEGKLSNGITPKGKDTGKNDYGISGINSYTDWFGGDEEMGGFYGSYDGPCPPWNDEVIHRYYFRLFALDTEKIDLNGNFTGDDLLKAIEGHIIDKAEYMGTYTLNKDLL